MSHYRHLNITEREEISRLLSAHMSMRTIASSLGRSVSTISREIVRNTSNISKYRAIRAQKKAILEARKPKKTRKLDTNRAVRQYVFECLHKYRWSPEQIAQSLTMRYPTDMIMRISHETIYQYVYILPRGKLKRQLASDLRRQHSRRRQRNIRHKCCPIQDFLSIEERPAEVADRIVPGHWEGDLIMGAGNKSAIGTLVERTKRFTILVKLKAKDATSVRKAFAREFKHIPPCLKLSLTYDHGQELAEHKLFTNQTNIQVYFAHPHSPWERGTNENTNGIVRDFFPKGTDFSKISKYKLKKVQRYINERPRKSLGWLSPSVAFSQLLH